MSAGVWHCLRVREHVPRSQVVPVGELAPGWVGWWVVPLPDRPVIGLCSLTSVTQLLSFKCQPSGLSSALLLTGFRLPVPPHTHPQLKLNVKYELKDEHDETVVCALMPVQINSH